MNKPTQNNQWPLPMQDEPEEQSPALPDYVGILLQYWKSVLFVMVLAVLIGAYKAWSASPVYETNTLIQVEPEPVAILGSDVGPPSAYVQDQARAPAEIELIQTRSVLSHVVRDLKLNIIAQPNYFGDLGAALARRHGAQAPVVGPPLQKLFGWLPAPLTRFVPDLNRFAWGGERITVSRLDVSPALKGAGFVLVAGSGGNYRVSCEADTSLFAGEPPAYCKRGTLFRGKVGQTARAQISGRRIQMFVAELRSRPGTEFLVSKLPIQEAVQQLQDSLRVIETAEGTGLLELTLEGPSAAAVSQRLNSIANTYLRQNVQRRSAETRQALAFVNSQLPEMKANVDATEAALRRYQATSGTVDLSLEAQTVLNNISKVESQISRNELRETALVRVYTSEYPLVETLQDKRVKLEQARARLEQQLKKLPQVQSDFLKLARNARVANTLYTQALNKAQELKVTEAGVTGYVHIVDRAFKPLIASGPSRFRIILVSVLLGAACAWVLVLLRRALRRTLETPDAIERQVGIPVYATVPHSKQEARLRKRKGKSIESSVLARRASNDSAIESLRSLRTALQFALIETNKNVITITGPTPGLGKTFVAVNLAFLLADAKKRVLLIDGDLRRGHIQRFLNHHRSPGLSDVIAGRCEPHDAAHAVEGKQLYFMGTGTLPPNPSELLVHDRFALLMETMSERFDMIIVDTPPILSVTDGIVIARHSGTTFLVVRGGVSTLHQVELSVKRLQQSDVKLSGVVFNDLKPGAIRYGHGKYGGYYTHQYKPAKVET